MVLGEFRRVLRLNLVLTVVRVRGFMGSELLSVSLLNFLDPIVRERRGRRGVCRRLFRVRFGLLRVLFRVFLSLVGMTLFGLFRMLRCLLIRWIRVAGFRLILIDELLSFGLICLVLRRSGMLMVILLGLIG